MNKFFNKSIKKLKKDKFHIDTQNNLNAFKYWEAPRFRIQCPFKRSNYLINKGDFLRLILANRDLNSDYYNGCTSSTKYYIDIPKDNLDISDRENNYKVQYRWLLGNRPNPETEFSKDITEIRTAHYSVDYAIGDDDTIYGFYNIADADNKNIPFVLSGDNKWVEEPNCKIPGKYEMMATQWKDYCIFYGGYIFNVDTNNAEYKYLNEDVWFYNYKTKTLILSPLKIWANYTNAFVYDDYLYVIGFWHINKDGKGYTETSNKFKRYKLPECITSPNIDDYTEEFDLPIYMNGPAATALFDNKLFMFNYSEFHTDKKSTKDHVVEDKYGSPYTLQSWNSCYDLKTKKYTRLKAFSINTGFYFNGNYKNYVYTIGNYDQGGANIWSWMFNAKKEKLVYKFISKNLNKDKIHTDGVIIDDEENSNTYRILNSTYVIA